MGTRGMGGVGRKGRWQNGWSAGVEEGGFFNNMLMIA